jgi:hypothetical protein
MSISSLKTKTISSSSLLVGNSIELLASFVLNGASGGGGNYSGGSSPSGAGGRVTGSLSIPRGTSYFLLVGARGLSMPPESGTGARPVGGGGLAGTLGYGGQGGGYSGIFTGSSAIHANAIMIAGGGGGGGSGSNTALAGGAGGGATGANGNGGGAGSGGTQSAGGAGFSAGSALLGGDCTTSDFGGGGGGGGGYYGGGAGGNGSPTDSGGGGGSSYFHPTLVLSPTTTSGAGAASVGGTSNGLNGSIVLTIPTSWGNLTIGGGLTQTSSTSGTNTIYTFTAGTGTVTF